MATRRRWCPPPCPPVRRRISTGVVLTGSPAAPVSPERVQSALSGRCCALQVLDETTARQELWDKCGEDTLRGLFLQQLRSACGADTQSQRLMEQAAAFGLAAIDRSGGMTVKHILMIGTGGTIASETDPLRPDAGAEHGAAAVLHPRHRGPLPCGLPAALHSLDSTNICPRHWLGLAAAIRDRYDDYDGFVIAHGTDTMAYTAAALSYLIQGSPKPIVLTGAQKPIWFDGTDSKRNLTDAFLYACRGCGGVQIVFNGKVILGTRARKTCSKSYHAFSSVNYP